MTSGSASEGTAPEGSGAVARVAPYSLDRPDDTPTDRHYVGNPQGARTWLAHIANRGSQLQASLVTSTATPKSSAAGPE